MLNFIDNLLRICWDLFFSIFAFLFYILSAFCSLIFEIIFGRTRKRELENLFEPFVDFLSELWKNFQKNIRRSQSFRLCVSFLVIVALLWNFLNNLTARWEKYETGIASYYGWGFYFKKTSSGERYWPWKYAAAHKTLPLGSTVKVKNLRNGKTIYVRIFDRGPYVEGRIIDLTWRAGKDLGISYHGLTEVEIYVKK